MKNTSKQRKINSEMLSYFLGNESSSPLLKNKNVVPYIAALKYKSKESLHLDLSIIQKKKISRDAMARSSTRSD